MTNAYPISFSWGKLILEMRLQGLAAMIACHSQPTHYDAAGKRLDICVDESLQELHDSPALGRLKDRIVDHFGESLQVNISFGPAPNSPAALSYAKRVGRFSKAYSTVANDDYVARIIEDFGAKIVVESVRPSGKKSMAAPD